MRTSVPFCHVAAHAQRGAAGSTPPHPAPLPLPTVCPPAAGPRRPARVEPTVPKTQRSGPPCHSRCPHAVVATEGPCRPLGSAAAQPPPGWQPLPRLRVAVHAPPDPPGVRAVRRPHLHQVRGAAAGGPAGGGPLRWLRLWSRVSAAPRRGRARRCFCLGGNSTVAELMCGWQVQL